MDQIYRNLELIANLKISNFKTKPDNIRYKLCTIYVLRNKINGKVYIGQTYKSPKDRWSDHKSQAITKSTKGYFQKAGCYAPRFLRWRTARGAPSNGLRSLRISCRQRYGRPPGRWHGICRQRNRASHR